MRALVLLVLVDDLERVVRGMLGVHDHQVVVVPVVEREVEAPLLLELLRLLHDMVLLVRQCVLVEPLPLRIRERPLFQRHVVEPFHLLAQVGDKVRLLRQRLQVLVPLRLQQLDEPLLQLRLRFVRAAPDFHLGHILVHDRELRAFRQFVVVHDFPFL